MYFKNPVGLKIKIFNFHSLIFLAIIFIVKASKKKKNTKIELKIMYETENSSVIFHELNYEQSNLIKK